MDFGSDSDGDSAFGGGMIEQAVLIRHRVNQLFGFEPKIKQVEAIRHLLYDKRDLILIAKTGFGKSIIFQALPLIEEGSKQASLIIMLLNLLQEEQAEKLKTIAGAKPFVLNGDTNTKKNRREIGAGAYTHGKCSYLGVTVETLQGECPCQTDDLPVPYQIVFRIYFRESTYCFH
jgi:superfamily II DNA helicase RecQ